MFTYVVDGWQGVYMCISVSTGEFLPTSHSVLPFYAFIICFIECLLLIFLVGLAQLQTMSQKNLPFQLLEVVERSHQVTQLQMMTWIMEAKEVVTVRWSKI